MLSYVHRLPLWIDRLCEHLGRLDVINLKKQQQIFASQYPKVFQFAAIAPKEMPVQEKIELNLPKKPKRRRNRRKKRDQGMIHDENLVQTSVQSAERSPDLVCNPNLKPVHILDQSMRPVMKLEQKQNTSNSLVQMDGWAQSGGYVSDPVQNHRSSLDPVQNPDRAESHRNDKSNSTLNVSRTETVKKEIPTTEVPTTQSQTSTEVEMVLNPRVCIYCSDFNVFLSFSCFYIRKCNAVYLI